MESKLTNLYSLISENINLDGLEFNKPKSKNKPSTHIAKYSRWFGTELERCITKIVFDLNLDISYNSGTIRLCCFPYILKNTSIDLKVYLTRNESGTYSKSLNEFIENYTLRYKDCYGIKDSNIKGRFIEEIKNALKNIDFQKFKADKLYVPSLTIYQELANKSRGGGIIDMIIDNKIIDIKTDISITKSYKKHISQLLFYYFILKTASKINFEEKEFTELSRFNIDTIALYYTRFDQLLEFKIQELVKNETKIQECFDNEIFYGNPNLRRIIECFVTKKLSLNIDDIQDKIQKERLHILKNHVVELLIIRDFEKARTTLDILLDEGFECEISFLYGLLFSMQGNSLIAYSYLIDDLKKSIQNLESLRSEISIRQGYLINKIEDYDKIAHPYNLRNFGASLKEYSDQTLFVASLNSMEKLIHFCQIIKSKGTDSRSNRLRKFHNP